MTSEVGDPLRLRGAVRRYARHRREDGCRAEGLDAPSEECSCGLGALVDKFEPERLEGDRGGD